MLDFAAIIEASQCLSRTIQLDELRAQLAQITLQHSGGDRCVLLRPHSEGQWYIEAIATSDQTTLCSHPLEDYRDLPLELIQYIQKHQVVAKIENFPETTLDDLPGEGMIGDYLQAKQPKSVLGLPILNQGQWIGILYLEHHTLPGVFTGDRLLILELLCTQAAISLENARLYQESQQYAQKLQHSLEQLQISQARYDYLATATSQIIWLASPQGENLDTVHWIAYTGQTPEEVQGTGWLNALHPDDLEHTTQVWLNAVESKTLYKTEYRIRGADGIYRYFAVQGVPILADDGTVKEWMGTCNNIDDRRRAENQLQQKSQQLEQTLQKLKSIQLQIIQSEKMASLGNLVAGVAHEINNPLGFLLGSINNGRAYVKDFMDHLALYHDYYPHPVSAIKDHAEEIDLEFLCQDMPQLLEAMEKATDRMKDISQSLRTFSRADSESKVSVDLHEGIDSTLFILKYRLKANEYRPDIDIIQDYGNLPLIQCFPGQLNQVFMNILANAIDVFDETAQESTFAELKKTPQMITVQTRQIDSQTIEIRIQDNGKGMTQEVKDKIFDHLFTTKEVGKGTGLGLAIARQIVEEKHGGSLGVKSELGKGTEFIVQLPLQ